jgi:hypothetical protein
VVGADSTVGDSTVGDSTAGDPTGASITVLPALASTVASSGRASDTIVASSGHASVFGALGSMSARASLPRRLGGGHRHRHGGGGGGDLAPGKRA